MPQEITKTIQQAVNATTRFDDAQAQSDYVARFGDIAENANKSASLSAVINAATIKMMETVATAAELGDPHLYGQAVASFLGPFFLHGVMVGLEMTREEEKLIKL